MTQWLIEEAAFAALDLADALTQHDEAAGEAQSSRLLEMALRQLRGGR